MHKNYACFVLSTGRCGTQWLHQLFEKYYNQYIRASHEPLDNRYFPRKQLKHKDHQEFLEYASPEVKDHIQDIKLILNRSHYLETGFPVWSSLTYLIPILKNQIRILFLTRHPISMAKSWLSLRVYANPILPHETEKVLLSSYDNGVKFPDYRKIWNALNQIEKLLYYWLEVNSLGVELFRSNVCPILHVSYEELFSSYTIQKITEFLNIPFNLKCTDMLNNKIDRFNYLTNFEVKEKILLKHPKVLNLMKSLDYL